MQFCEREGEVFYKVVKGETLNDIAKKFNVSCDYILNYNNIDISYFENKAIFNDNENNINSDNTNDKLNNNFSKSEYPNNEYFKEDFVCNNNAKSEHNIDSFNNKFSNQDSKNEYSVYSNNENDKHQNYNNKWETNKSNTNKFENNKNEIKNKNNNAIYFKHFFGGEYLFIAGQKIISHIVRPLESLTFIAKKYNIEPQKILSFNNINTIFIGQKLFIPQK